MEEKEYELYIGGWYEHSITFRSQGDYIDVELAGVVKSLDKVESLRLANWIIENVK